MKTHVLLILPLLALSCAEHQCEVEAPPTPMVDFTPLGIRRISFSPNGKWLVGGGWFLPVNAGRRPYGGDGFVKVWDSATWKQFDSYNEGFTDPAKEIIFPSEDTFAITTTKIIREAKGSPFDGILIRSWNMPAKKEMAIIHLKSTLSAAGADYSRPTKLFALDGKLLTFPQFAIKVEIQGSRGGYMRFAPDGKQILCTDSIQRPRSPGASLSIHGTANGKLLAQLELVEEDIRYASYSPNGKRILVGTQSSPLQEGFGRIHVLASDLSAKLYTIELGHPSTFAIFTPDNEHVINAEGHDYVEIHSIQSKKTVKAFKGNPEGAHCCCFSPDGSLIAIGCGGRMRNGKIAPAKVRVFAVKTGLLVAELE